MKKSLLLIALIALFGGLFYDGLRVSAFDAGEMDSTMTISPPRQKIVLVPGETFRSKISVYNPSTSKSNLKYSVKVASFNLVKDENGKVDYEDSDTESITSYNQIVDWIQLEKTSGIVAPGDGDEVIFTVAVPKDAPAGGQYASIIFQNDSDTDEMTGNGFAIQNVIQFATTIIAEVAGETRNEGKILENSIPAISFSTPLTASSTVKNEGNVHTDAEYTLQVWPLFSNEEICTNEEKPETSLIMPETERYHAQTCNTPALGIFRVKQTVKIFGETSIVEKTVFICPLWLLFIVIFAITFAIIWLVSKNRSRKKKTTE